MIDDHYLLQKRRLKTIDVKDRSYEWRELVVN
jgi:hypothetical protein